MSQRIKLASALVCVLVAFALATPASAQVANTGTIPQLSSWGMGEAKVRPDTVEMLARVSGEAELSKDAIVKFEDTKRRAIETLNGLKIPGLEVVGEGVSIYSGTSQEQMMKIQRGEAVPGKAGQQVMASEQLRVTIKGVDKLEQKELIANLTKLIDGAADAGLTVGGGSASFVAMRRSGYYGNNQAFSVFAFKVTKIDEVRDKAREAAIKDAKERAAKVAQQAGAKLGRLLMLNSDDANTSYGYGGYDQGRQQLAQMFATDGGPGQAPLTDSLGEMTVRVRVNLAYEIKAE